MNALKQLPDTIKGLNQGRCHIYSGTNEKINTDAPFILKVVQ